MTSKPKLIRVTTIAKSLKFLLQGQLHFMSAYFDVTAISTPDPVLDEVAETEKVKVLPVVLTRTISPIKDIKSVYSLYKIFKKEKPLIVHTHTPKAGTAGMIAAKLAGVPHRLHTVAGLPLLAVAGKKRWLLNQVEKLTYACATRVYPNSMGLYKIIIDNKFTTSKKMKVIANGSSNGIDTSFFDPNTVPDKNKKDLLATLDISETDFVFLFIGRVVKDKGINELVNAFIKLQEGYTNIKLVLVGSFENDLNPILPEIAKEIDVNTSIIATGYQPNVKDYYAIGDVLVFPSYREGFPNVVMQAAAMGLNSIVTDINGCNEIITDGYNGFIIPPKNSDQLYHKMKYLLENPSENMRMSKNTRKSICENYERTFVWQKLLEEYKTLL